MQSHWFLICLFFLVYSVACSKDYYKILNLPRNASKKDIKKRYRELSIKYHPDKTKDEADRDRYIEIGKAYEVLSDDEKRRIYDRYGEEGLQPNPGFGGFGGFNMFNQQRREQTTPNLEFELFVTLEELYNGKTINLHTNRQVICSHCRGSGAKSESHVKRCTTCNGQGIRIIKQQIAPGLFQQMQTTCNVCNGKGQITTEHCPVCKGHKVQRGPSTLRVAIEKGMYAGERIIFSREADESPDMAAGDVTVILREQIHDVFTRVGDDLKMKYYLTLKQALLGFKFEIPHLDGDKLTLSRTGVTQNGFILKIPQKGMPRDIFGDSFGDLYVEFFTILPKSLSDSQATEIQKIL